MQPGGGGVGAGVGAGVGVIHATSPRTSGTEQKQPFATLHVHGVFTVHVVLHELA